MITGFEYSTSDYQICENRRSCVYTANCGSCLEVLTEPKDNTAHIGLYGVCTYGQSYLSFVVYFNGTANTYHTRSQTEEAQLLNENSDFKIYIVAGG